MNGGESDMNHEMNDTVSLLLMVTMFQSVASLLIGIFGYSRNFAVFGVAFHHIAGRLVVNRPFHKGNAILLVAAHGVLFNDIGMAGRINWRDNRRDARCNIIGRGADHI